jgi:hypothetical protein
MTLTELAIIVSALLGLAALRFGLPLLVMWLINQFCCRVLQLTPGQDRVALNN